MKQFLKTILSALILLTATTLGTQAGDGLGYKSVTAKGEFDSVFVDVQDAIVNKGYTIDYVGHFNQMLKRTSKTVGSVTEKGSLSPYKHAKFMQFCSALLTHEAISANPQNIAICPYVVFVYEEKTDPGLIHVGYRRPVAGPSKRTRKAIEKIEAMLTSIITEAVK